jgi:hypothetical protein
MDWHKKQIAEARNIAKSIPNEVGHCGDILDRLPCVQCGATRLRDCPVTAEQAKPIVDLINRTAYLGYVLRIDAERRRTDGGKAE